MRRAAPEAFKAFHFQTGDMQDFKIGAYEAGRRDFFRPHRDNSSPKTQHRKFALSINLNDDYEGGGVTFPEYGSTAYTTPAGASSALAFQRAEETIDGRQIGLHPGAPPRRLGVLAPLFDLIGRVQLRRLEGAARVDLTRVQRQSDDERSGRAHRQ